MDITIKTRAGDREIVVEVYGVEYKTDAIALIREVLNKDD